MQLLRQQVTGKQLVEMEDAEVLNRCKWLPATHDGQVELHGHDNV